MKTVMNQKELRKSINSFVIASSCTINTIYAVLTYSRGIQGIASLYLAAVYFLGIANVVIFNKGRIEFKFGKSFCALELFLLCSCVLTMLFAEEKTTMTIGNFFFYCLLPPLFLLFEFDTEKVLRYGMYLSLISCLEVNTLLADQAISWRFSQTNLGTIYDLLPCIVLAMYHFAYYRKKASVLTKLCYVYYVYVLIKMLFVIVRGALLTLMVGLAIIYLNRPQNKWEAIRSWSMKKKILIGFGVVLATLAVLNFDLVITWLYTTLESMGINFGVITKFYFYMSTGNITDNREPYYELVHEMFLKSPIWGTGVQTFYAYSLDGAAYPHNYVLQFLFEGGLVLMVPLTFITLRELYRVLAASYVSVDKMVFSACLLLLSVVPGMFSINIWYNRTFWMAVMFGLMAQKKDFRLRGESAYENRRINISPIS